MHYLFFCGTGFDLIRLNWIQFRRQGIRKAHRDPNQPTLEAWSGLSTQQASPDTS